MWRAASSLMMAAIMMMHLRVRALTPLLPTPTSREMLAAPPHWSCRRQRVSTLASAAFWNTVRACSVVEVVHG